MTASFAVSVMARSDLDQAIDWAAAEGWNPGLHDADAFMAADPEGFLIGRLGPEAIACISAVRYHPDFAFIGFYIVKAAYRGRGHGKAIWDQAMTRLSGRTIGLDGVIAQQANYERSGFKLAHRQIRFGNDCPTIALPPEDWRKPLTEIPRDAWIAYDRRHFPADRADFLDQWVSRPGVLTVGALKDGAVTGYAVARPCRDGHKIGPLFADDEATAESLVLDLWSRIKTGKVFLDVPEPNKAGSRLAERFRFKPVFETARMYHGPAPALLLDRIFGVTSFELG